MKINKYINCLVNKYEYGDNKYECGDNKYACGDNKYEYGDESKVKNKRLNANE